MRNKRKSKNFILKEMFFNWHILKHGAFPNEPKSPKAARNESKPAKPPTFTMKPLETSHYF